MKNLFVISIFLLGGVFTINTVSAQGMRRGRGRGMGMGRGMGHMGMHHHGMGMGRGMGRGMGLLGNIEFAKKELGLTATQLKNIAKLNIKHQKSVLDIRKKVVPLKIELRKQLLSTKLNLVKIKGILTQIAMYQVKTRMLHITHRVNIMNVLTAAQRKKLNTYRALRMGRRGMGRGGRGMRGMGRGMGMRR